VGGFSKGEHSSSILTPYDFEVDEVSKKENCRTGWGSMPCDLLSNPTERALDK
jgi:hypothetical protein